MNKKEQKEIKKAWVLVCLAALIGFFINLAANSFYDFYMNGYDLKFLCVFVLFAGVSLFMAGFFAYFFDLPLEVIKDENKSFWGFLSDYIKSRLK